jgi:sugar phosphate isomerase/epimerase
VKLGVYSDDLATDFATAARLAADHGAVGIGVRNVWGRKVTDLEPDEVGQVRRIADEHGLECAAVGSQYGRNLYLDDDEAQPAAARLLEKAIAHAEILGTPRVRIFALWLRGQDELPEWSRRPDLGSCLDRLVARLEPSIVMAERAGVTLMVELEGASYAGQVAEARDLLERVNSPSLALCWDVANGWWSGELPWPNGFAAAQGLNIVDVQTKDVHANPANPEQASFDRAVVGEGDIPYPDILRALAQQGYAGYVTAERVHHPLKPEEQPELQRDSLADLGNLRKMVEDALNAAAHGLRGTMSTAWARSSMSCIARCNRPRSELTVNMRTAISYRCDRHA